MPENLKKGKKMASEQTGRDAVNQLQEIRSEVAQVKGLSKFTAHLLISDAKNRGIDLVDEILKKFTPVKAKIYLLVDGFRSSVKIGKSVDISQPAAHGHLQGLIKAGLIDRDNPGSTKAVYKKSGVEDAIGLSSLLKRKFGLHEWLDKATSQADE